MHNKIRLRNKCLLLICISNFLFKGAIPSEIPGNDATEKIWRVSAKWVLDSWKSNEWTVESDYEVDETGEKIIQSNLLSVDDFERAHDEVNASGANGKKNPKKSKERKDASKSPKTGSTSQAKIELNKASTSRTTRGTASKNGEGHKEKSRRSGSGSGHREKHGRKMPTTECPDCGKTITVKRLNSHRKEIHQPGAERFHCNLCEMSFTRQSILSDHQRRIHFEPMRVGRPEQLSKENEKEVHSALGPLQPATPSL